MLRLEILAGLLGFIGCLPARGQTGETPAPALPVIPAKIFRVTDYGAVGDGKRLNTAALQKAIDAVKQAGGGTLTVPAGQFLTGPLVLASSLNLQLAKGAVLLISDDVATYPVAERGYQDCLSANEGHDIEISGEGTIDGQGAVWWQNFRAKHEQHHRPFLVTFSHCMRVEITGIKLTNSPMFHLAPGRCTDVTIKGVTILAPADSPNTDGIDPSGSNYLIEGCTIDTGDDNIAVKPVGTIKDQNFTIRDCHFLHGHGMSIGSGSKGGVENMTVGGCTFDGTTAGIRIKTARDKGGLVQNIIYEDLTMTGVKDPVMITDYYPKPPSTPTEDPAQPITPQTPTFAAITIRNVTSTGSPSAGTIWGLPEMPISGITFTNVHISAAKGMTIVHARGLHFSGSGITVESGEKLILSDAEASGLN